MPTYSCFPTETRDDRGRTVSTSPVGGCHASIPTYASSVRHTTFNLYGHEQLCPAQLHPRENQPVGLQAVKVAPRMSCRHRQAKATYCVRSGRLRQGSRHEDIQTCSDSWIATTDAAVIWLIMPLGRLPNGHLSGRIGPIYVLVGTQRISMIDSSLPQRPHFRGQLHSVQDFPLQFVQPSL